MSYKDKLVCVTGAGGFIASHLTEALLEAGARVRALVRYTSRGTHGFLQPHPNLEIMLGDVRDAGLMREFVESSDVVFHLAALIGIPYSYHAPESYFDVNVGGAMNVLNAAREHVVRVVITSTSEVYGTALYTPIDEAHPLQAQSPYSASKIASDKLAESYYRAFGLPVVTVRPFNTYGPRQSTRAVIPTIISQLLMGAKTLKLGSLTPRRDMLYVADTVHGFMLAGEADVVGQTINLGTERTVSVEEIAKECMFVVGQHVPIESDDDRIRPANSEVEVLQADTYRAKQLLHWEPLFDLRSGLRVTVEYMRGLTELKGEYAV